MFGEDALELGRRMQVCSELKRGGRGVAPAPGAPGGPAEADGGLELPPRSQTSLRAVSSAVGPCRSSA